MKRHLLAATLLALQTAAVFAVNPPKTGVRGNKTRTNKASGEMQRGGEHMLSGFATPIKNGDVEAYKKALEGYKGGELGLYALIGKLAIAVDENHADTNVSQGDMAQKTRHLHEMRDVTMEKLKTHTSMRGEGQRKPRGERKSPAAKRGMKQNGNKRVARSGAARKAAVGKKALPSGVAARIGE